MRRIPEGGAKEQSNDLLTLKHSKEKEEKNRGAWEKVDLHARGSDICVHNLKCTAYTLYNIIQSQAQALKPSSRDTLLCVKY